MATTRISAAWAERITAAGILYCRTERGLHSQPPRRFEVDVRGGLAAADLFRGNGRLEKSP
jgi:hypothetical protein